MALLLVQHGISEPKEVDPERGLSDRGLKETKLIAGVAKNYKVQVGKIVHSGKKRAAQTAAVFHEALNPQAPLEVISGISPMDDVERFAATIDSGEDLMVVGHLPFMERFVSLLTCGSADARVCRFQNSGIVCLELEEGESNAGGWFIKWTLNPNIP